MHSPYPDLNDPALRDRAVRAAQGQEAFDMLLVNGRVADVATGEIRDADIGLTGPLIASVHPRGTFHDAGQVIDLGGRIVAPGLIDSHLHIESSMVTPRSYAGVVVPQGTTTICWDPHEVGNVGGLEAVRWAIAAARGLPLRIIVLAPSCVPSAPGLERSGAVFDGTAMEEMLSWPEVRGVAEIMDMRGVLARSPLMRGITQAGLESGKLVCGHARDLAGRGLQGFLAAGIESDHEITSEADLLEKIRAGMTIELRVSHEDILPQAVALFGKLGHVPQTVTLCTDDIFPDDLVSRGGMAYMLRRLVQIGLDPVQALRAATLNTAMRLQRRDLGLVAPGRRADLVVFDDLKEFRAHHVFASGRHVAEDGALCEPLRPDPVAAPTETMKLALTTEQSFHIPATGTHARVRTVAVPRTTRWGEREVAVRDGHVVIPEDAALMAVFNRYGASDVPGLGILEGWGEWSGAVATTVLHDSHNLAVIGRGEADMMLAANTLIRSGGGMVAVRDGRVLAHLELPVCGLLSASDPQEVARQFKAVRDACASVTTWDGHTAVIKLMIGASLACNPGPHVTDMGITSGMTGEVVTDCVLA
ncbi:adenine deaminase [Komagataeibacter rhaeticus]|uniref:adenine deaminase n=1 Tax=Komagataeibacter rhaeticus TaxID=215221 RepID=UPI0004D47E12|nr:adenine deaminase C-terminal domain-containing protein [Komagataeibacter rhaeticus]KDU96633.1 adenine deaminase [Komagataeibacter rhaeticus AF1]MBL7239252.1 adenine deaminase [Komagataeibacter rhaeticus]PYD52720.1 adenine deaminase [Komagataeibacter rhaeticus]